jgi:hypothetical protein
MQKLNQTMLAIFIRFFRQKAEGWKAEGTTGGPKARRIFLQSSSLAQAKTHISLQPLVADVSPH